MRERGSYLLLLIHWSYESLKIKRRYLCLTEKLRFITSKVPDLISHLITHVSVTAFTSESTSKPAPHTQGFRRCQPPSSQLQRMQIIWGSIFFMSTKIERIWISRDIKGPAKICAVPKIGLLDIVIWKNYFLNNLKKRSCEIFTVLRMARNSNPPFDPVNESKLIVVLIGKPINLCQV